MPRSRSVSLVLLAMPAALLLSGTGCVMSQSLDTANAADVDARLTPYAYSEDGRLVAFIVSTRAATFRKKQDYFPVEICIANKRIPELTISRESFTLIDEAGNRYPAVEPEELLAGYDYLDLDRSRFSELPGLLGTRFDALKLVPPQLGPTRRGSVVRSVVQLPRAGAMFDWVYFPMPPQGLEDQRFELFLDTPELEDPVFVRFRVR